jgi:hypothetical protein
VCYVETGVDRCPLSCHTCSKTGITYRLLFEIAGAFGIDVLEHNNW